MLDDDVLFYMSLAMLATPVGLALWLRQREYDRWRKTAVRVNARRR